MTSTLTTVKFDKFLSTYSSSVIDHVYYSTKDQLLFVELHSGVLCGYSNVQPEIFTALKSCDENRRNGDTSDSASVGAYWNNWIKPFLKGFNTEGIELVEAEELVVEGPVAPEPARPKYVFHVVAMVQSQNFVSIEAEDEDAALADFDDQFYEDHDADTDSYALVSVTKYYI